MFQGLDSTAGVTCNNGRAIAIGVGDNSEGKEILRRHIQVEVEHCV